MTYLEDELWYSKIEHEYLRSEIDDLAFKTYLDGIILKMFELKKEATKTKGYYLVVDLSECCFELRKGDRLIRKGKCGIGKGTKMVGDKKWDFVTPSGEFAVREKAADP